MLMATPLKGFSKILKGRLKLRLHNPPIRIIQIKVWLKNPVSLARARAQIQRISCKIGNC